MALQEVAWSVAQSADGWSRIGRLETRNTRREKTTRKNGPQLPGNAHKPMGRNWAAVARLWARQGLGYLYVRPEVETIYATQRGEREKWEREK